MTNQTLVGLLLAVLTTMSAYGQQPAQASLHILLNEVQPGTMYALQMCTVIFDDHRFHSETVDLKQGKAADRKIYEGQVSDADWNALSVAIDSKEFRDLSVPREVPPLVMAETHPYTISVARGKNFQNMEFLDKKSLKPYEAQVKPLLQWWKTFRGKNTTTSPTASPDAHCQLDNSHPVFAQ